LVLSNLNYLRTDNESEEELLLSNLKVVVSFFVNDNDFRLESLLVRDAIRGDGDNTAPFQFSFQVPNMSSVSLKGSIFTS
jgi:hypothetical protein